MIEDCGRDRLDKGLAYSEFYRDRAAFTLNCESSLLHYLSSNAQSSIRRPRLTDVAGASGADDAS